MTLAFGSTVSPPPFLARIPDDLPLARQGILMISSRRSSLMSKNRTAISFSPSPMSSTRIISP